MWFSGRIWSMVFMPKQHETIIRLLPSGPGWRIADAGPAAPVPPVNTLHSFYLSILNSCVDSKLLTWYMAVALNHTYDIMLNLYAVSNTWQFPLLPLPKTSDIKNTPQATGGCLKAHIHTAQLQSQIYWLETFFFLSFFKPCNMTPVSINKFVALTMNWH